jgi:hypothetical protein
MSAYIVVEVDVKDPERYADYRAMVPASLEIYGGEFLVRGGAVEKLEGDWQPSRCGTGEALVGLRRIPGSPQFAPGDIGHQYDRRRGLLTLTFSSACVPLTLTLSPQAGRGERTENALSRNRGDPLNP